MLKSRYNQKIIFKFAEIKLIMKSNVLNLLKVSTLLIVVVFSLSCRRNKTPDNYFKIGDSTYEIKSGSIINNGEVEGGFNVDLRLYDESGKNFINFTFISKEAERIASSTYRNPDGSWVLGHNSNGTYSSMAKVNSGVVKIDRSSDGYTIDIKCTDQYSTEIRGYFKGDLSKKDNDNLVRAVPKYVLPDEIYDEVTQHFPVYSGVTPPNMQGEYVSSPHILIYESYAENPDSVQVYSDRYMGFIYTNKQMNFYGKQYDVVKGDYEEVVQYGVKITGSNDLFTCYYVVDGYVQGYYAQQSFIFSGKKTDTGLEDFHTAVVLLENSGNPNMYAKNSYRVLKDEDGLAENNLWLSGRNSSKPTHSQNEGLFDIWMK